MPVSIVTAAFSYKYLDGVWESIKKQTCKNWEWIIVIDGSKEVSEWYNRNRKSGEFEGYDIWVITIDKNQGRFGLVARNVGAMCASYNWIQFLDDDNEFEESEYLEELKNTIKNTGKIPYTKLHLLGKKPGSTYDRYKDTSLGRHHIDLGNPIYRKDLFLKYRGFDDSQNKIMFDFDLIQRIMEGEGSDKFIQVDKHLLFRHKRY